MTAGCAARKMSTLAAAACRRSPPVRVGVRRLLSCRRLVGFGLGVAASARRDSRARPRSRRRRCSRRSACRSARSPGRSRRRSRAARRGRSRAGRRRRGGCAPRWGRRAARAALMSVVLPAPFSPTSATRSPGRSVKSRRARPSASLPGYWKPTSSNDEALADRARHGGRARRAR